MQIPCTVYFPSYAREHSLTYSLTSKGRRLLNVQLETCSGSASIERLLNTSGFTHNKDIWGSQQSSGLLEGLVVDVKVTTLHRKLYDRLPRNKFGALVSMKSTLFPFLHPSLCLPLQISLSLLLVVSCFYYHYLTFATAIPPLQNVFRSLQILPGAF